MCVCVYGLKRDLAAGKPGAEPAGSDVPLLRLHAGSVEALFRL